MSNTETTFRITNRTSGMDMGEYRADTAEDAVRLMNREAGYKTDAEAEEVLGVSFVDSLADLDVEEIEEVGNAATTPQTLGLIEGEFDKVEGLGRVAFKLDNDKLTIAGIEIGSVKYYPNFDDEECRFWGTVNRDICLPTTTAGATVEQVASQMVSFMIAQGFTPAAWGVR